MKEAFLPLILNCENIFKTFNIMKVLMVFCSTPLQVVWDYCAAGILIFWEAEKEMNAQSFCILSKNISVGVRGQK